MGVPLYFQLVLLIVTTDTFAPDPTTRPTEVPSTQPAWLSLGGTIYQEKTVTDAEHGVLAFDKTPLWFMPYGHPATTEEIAAYRADAQKVRDILKTTVADAPEWIPNKLPYPQSVTDVPIEDRGVRLSLQISPTTDPALLQFDLDLTSDQRPVWREVEHRWTMRVPMLFAIFVDGKQVTCADEAWNRSGGVNAWIPLITKAGGERHWSLKVDAASLQKLLPDDNRHQVAIAAAFSERQMTWRTDTPSPEASPPPNGHEGPQVLVRSELATINWTGKKWVGTAETDSRAKSKP